MYCIGDRRVNEIPARQRDAAMVFQNYALCPHMTVAEDLTFGLRMRQADLKSIRVRIEAVAQVLDITHLLDRYPKQLSSSYQVGSSSKWLWVGRLLSEHQGKARRQF